jgi:hypothetical protein
MKIVERAMDNCYLGDGTIHPGDHLLFIHELCELFKCTGISMNQVKRKLFSLSLKGRAMIRLKRIYNFLCSMLFLHHLPCVSLHFVAFLCDFRN